VIGAILFLGVVAAHTCGHGPVTISLTTERDCPTTPMCAMEQHIATPATYRTVCPPPCHMPGVVNIVWDANFVELEDWPECLVVP
jgi:hypothetical protein